MFLNPAVVEFAVPAVIARLTRAAIVAAREFGARRGGGALALVLGRGAHTVATQVEIESSR